MNSSVKIQSRPNQPFGAPRKKLEVSFRVAKRGELSWKRKVVYYAIGVLVAIIVGCILVASLGQNPFVYFAKVFEGCFRSELSFQGMLRIFMPLFITSLGVAVAFKMKFWNIGAEGQFIMGAVGATWVARMVGNSLPNIIVILLMMIAGIVFGGLFGMVVAVLQVQFKTNETLLTLMLNYVALYLIFFLEEGPWNQGKGQARIEQLPISAWLGQVFGVDITWMIAIVLMVAMFLYMRYSKQGYEISVVGESINTARYAGMNVKKIVVRTMFLSAAICGLAGMLQVSGEATSHTLTTNIAGGIGFTAIIVAWLAKLNPFGMVGISFMFALLGKGCQAAELSLGLNSAVANLIQSIVLFIILGTDFFINYKLMVNHKKKDESPSTPVAETALAKGGEKV